MSIAGKEVWRECRVRTRITGLDRLLYGGLCLGQEPYLIVMKGAADTEKTMFGMQMLYGIAQSPTVYLEDHMLTFPEGHPDYVLCVKESDGNEVYSTYVSSADTQITLPSNLSGNYDLEPFMGNWLFVGTINL